MSDSNVPNAHCAANTILWFHKFHSMIRTFWPVQSASTFNCLCAGRAGDGGTRVWTRALLGADWRRNLLLPGENLPTQEESNPQENWETGNTRSRSQRYAPPTTPWLLPSHPPDHLLSEPEAPSGENGHPVGYVSPKLMKHHWFLVRFSFLSPLFAYSLTFVIRVGGRWAGGCNPPPFGRPKDGHLPLFIFGVQWSRY